MARRPPGPERPMTRERILVLRDLVMELYPGGTKSQTLSVVSRRCKSWGRLKSPRRKPVTGGQNLELATQILTEQPLGSTKLYWEMFKRNPAVKLFERSCVALHKVAKTTAEKRRAQRQK